MNESKKAILGLVIGFLLGALVFTLKFTMNADDGTASNSSISVPAEFIP